MSRVSEMMRRWLSGQVLEPLFWAVKGLPIYKRYKWFKLIQTRQNREFNKEQLEKLKKIAIHAIENIPYYTSLNISRAEILQANTAYSVLNLFPVLNKTIVREAIEQLHIDYDGSAYTNHTGGSTGEPVTFFQDKNYLIDSLATTLLMFEWAGRRPGERSVKLWGAERDLVDGTLGWKHKLADWIANRVTLNSFSMTLQKQEQYRKIINQSKPVLIEGYADSLYDFARFLHKTKSQVYTPRAIVSSAGTMHPHMRELVEEVFACKVFDRYGSREAGNMAAECEAHNGLHIFGETSVLEVVDQDYQACHKGDEGNILVTNLTNFTMPLIRYEIGDRAVLGESQCSCGKPYSLLASISGRSSGSFKLEQGGTLNPQFFIHIMGVSCNDGSINKFQLIQKELDFIVIKIVFFKNRSLGDWTQKSKAEQIIKKAMGNACVLEFTVVDDIPLTQTGKHLYTICELDNE